MQLPYDTPNKALLRELRQVGEDADGVLQALDEVNYLPDTFPREVLEDLCRSLVGLQNGTAENCRPTLEYVRNKIPEIRRGNFHLLDDGLEEAQNGEDMPRLYRGMALDRQLGLLFSAVGTTLDEYREQAQERFDDQVRGEEVVALSHPDETRVPTAEASSIIATSTSALSELRDKGVDRTDKGDTLSRRLQDSQNLAFAARSQIVGGKIVRRWFESISVAISRLPDLISQAGRAIRTGTDIADTLADWWSNTEHQILRTLIDQVRGFGKALEEISEKLKRRRSTEAATPAPGDTSRDPDLVRAEAEVERMLKAGTKVPDHLARIVQEIDVSGDRFFQNQIRRWHDIERFISLRSIRVSRTNFSILKHLGYLTNLQHLEELRLGNVPNVDLAPLSNLTTLRRLSLQANNVHDVAPLANLTALQALSIAANGLLDIKPLANLTALRLLSLHANSVSDIAPIANLSALRSLSLHANDVSDLAPIANLAALESLALHAHRTEDITPIANLTALTTLSISANSVLDIAPIANLTKLTSLTLNAHAASDIAPIAQLTTLTSLSLQANSARDLTPMASLPELTLLSLHANSAENLIPLAKLTKLRSLSLHVNTVSNLAPLADLTDLTSLSITANNVSDLTPLGNLTALKSLLVNANNAPDLTPLANLLHLTTLSVTAYSVRDIAPLANLSALTSLTLTANSTSDLSPLAKLTSLSSMSLYVKSIDDWTKAIGQSPLREIRLSIRRPEKCAELAKISTLEHIYVDSEGEFDLRWLTPLPNLKTVEINGMSVINRRSLKGVELVIL